MDLSRGGCFVEMSNPLPQGTFVKIGLWIRESKLWANGRVVHSTPGFGIGVQFTEMSEKEREVLDEFLRSITRLSV
jgi:hypothetical protein